MTDDIDLSAIVVRDATETDIPHAHAIYSHHVLKSVGSFEETPPTLSEMIDRFRAVTGKGNPFLVAEWNGAVKGFSYANTFRPRTAYRYTVEDSIYIAPDSLGVGIGRMLLRTLIDRCSAMGYRRMVAVIGGGQENAASITLHARMGFRTVGIIDGCGYKFERWADTAIMQRALGEGNTTSPDH